MPLDPTPQPPSNAGATALQPQGPPSPDQFQSQMQGMASAGGPVGTQGPGATEAPATAIQNIPTPPPNVPGNHSGMIAMLKAISMAGVATSAAGASLGSGGRSGGAKDVIAYQEQQANEERTKAAFTQQQQEFGLRTQALQAQTNHQILATQLMMDKAPAEIQMAHLEVQKALIDTYKEAGLPPMLAVLMVQGQGTNEHAQAVQTAMGPGGMTSKTAIPSHSGDGRDGTGSTNIYDFKAMEGIMIPKELIPNITNKLGNEIELAKTAGVDPATIKSAQAQLKAVSAAPSMTGKDLFQLSTGLENSILSATATKRQQVDEAQKLANLQESQQKADPVFQAKAAAMKTGAEQAAKLPYELKLKSAEADIAAGDPSMLAHDLVAGALAPSQIPKRSQVYQRAIIAAQKLDPTFNPGKSDLDFKFASNVGTQNTLKYLTSLTGANGKGGNLGDLLAMSDRIPRATNFPGLNDKAAWAKLEAGNVDMAQYHTIITEVSDQVAKILQGGGGGATSDAKMKQAGELFRMGFTKDQMHGVATSLSSMLQNRKLGLAGGNKFLQEFLPANAPGGLSPTGSKAAPAAAPGATHVYDPSTGGITPIGGK